MQSLKLDWEEVGEAERRELREQLLAAAGLKKAPAGEEMEWFKVDWERVPDLVEQRRVLVKKGMAYVPQREQMSLVLAEFTKRLDAALEVCLLSIEPLLFLYAGKGTGHVTILTRHTAHIPRPSPPRRR